MSSWEREVVELHEFFEGWLAGTLPRTKPVFARVEAVLLPGFTLAGPGEKLRTREEVLRGLWKAQGKFASPPLEIEVQGFSFNELPGGMALVTYEEVHLCGEERTVRASRAVLGPSAAAPLEIGWVRLKETWLEAPKSGDG